MRDIDLGIDILLSEQGKALWSEQTKREALRFLRKRSGEMNGRQIRALARAIVDGPPPAKKAKVQDEEAVRRQEHSIRVRLRKLAEGGAQLPKYAEKVLNRIDQKMPWMPGDEHQEEYALFISRHSGREEEASPSLDFSEMEPEDFVDWANQLNGLPWEVGDGWDEFVQSNADATIQLLRDVSTQGIWPIAPWYTVLDKREPKSRWSKRQYADIGRILLTFPDENLAQLALPAARWLEVFRKKIGKRLRIEVFQKIWRASLLQEEPKQEIDFNLTLNHAGGVLAQCLYDELAEKIPQVRQGENYGFPRNLESCFELFDDSESLSARLARARLSSMLLILLRVDASWTERVLLSRMDADSEKFDALLWEAFLWRPRWSDDLLIAFKDRLFKVLSNLGLVGQSVRRNAAQLFVHMAIPPGRGVSTEEAKAVLHSFEPSDLANSAWALKDIVQAAGNKSERLWDETIEPWFTSAWPKKPASRSSALSSNLAWMAISSGKAFPKVVRAVEGVLIAEEHETALFHLSEEENRCHFTTRYPRETLMLIDKLVGEKERLHIGDRISALLGSIEKADSSVKRLASYRRLRIKLT